MIMHLTEQAILRRSASPQGPELRLVYDVAHT